MKPARGTAAAGPLLLKIAAVASAVFLFSASFPNLLFKNGLPFLAWIAYVPVFWLARTASWKTVALWGGFYGYAAYAVFNYWLSGFNPLAGLIVSSIYFVYLALLFIALKASYSFFPQKGYLVQWLAWMAFEYLRTLGFVGYAYGITGYSQWAFLPLIQCASVFGVWGVSALVVFPSAYLAAAFNDGPRGFRSFVAKNWMPACSWAVAVVSALAFGLASPVELAESPTRRFALVQNNADPWQGGAAVYRQNLEVLKRLSDEALSGEVPPDIVVWSETAFVPRIYWHKTYRDDPESYGIVKDLLDYLASKDVPFVIGTDDGRLEPDQDGNWERVDYNAVMLFESGEEKAVYRKLHLVPFTEHFPYEKQLPAVHKALVEADTHFWKKGTEATVFQAAGMRFSTPICFEDTFGYLSRRFVSNGADVIVNLTNDAWAKSLPSQMQHAAMAVFRAVENRRSVVRATASGQTWAIDPNGRILAEAPPFKEAQLTVDVPVNVGPHTPYTRFGDVWAIGFVVAAAVCLAAGAVRRIDRAVAPVSIDKRIAT